MTLTKKQMNLYLDAIAQPQSTYALRNFVNGGQYTPERRFRQSVLELSASQRALRDAQFAIEELQIDLAEVQDRLTDVPPKDYTVYDRKRDKLQARRLDYDIQESKRKILGLQREMDVHLQLLQQYQEELGFHAGTTLDEVIDRLEGAEADHYVTKLAMDAAAHHLMSKGGPGIGVSQAFQQLPREDIERVGATAQTLLRNMMDNRYTEALHSPEGVKVLQHGSYLKSSSNGGVDMPADPKIRTIA